MIDILAKLLATENIVVEHRHTRTASFDTKNRVLTLPMWKNITPALEALLVGHEVGHALYTPTDGWDSIQPKLKNICNIIEDPRIERKIKIMYPGLRRDFHDGYKELFENNFFQIKGKNLEKMNFLDRINIHFKLGLFQKVNFSEEELNFVVDIENAMTWDDVVDITYRVFEFLQQKEKNNLKRSKEHFSDDEDGMLDEDEMLYGDDEEKVLDGDDEEEVLDGDDEEEVLDAWARDDELVSETQNAMETNISEKLIDQSSKPIVYINVRDVDYKNRVYTYSKLFSIFNDEETLYRGNSTNHSNSSKELLDELITKANLIRWNKFLNVNGKVVSYLVKEFEMKKAADQYVRRREGKTGVINSNKLHAYKIIEDIFKKTIIVPESKNHGLVMFVDFSGSMAGNIKGTIEQLLCLTLFCRKINIPHRVYAFTTQFIPEKYRNENDSVLKNPGDIVLPEHHILFELFTEKMRNDEFSRMGKYLLNFSEGVGNDYRREPGWFHTCITLNSTPLNSALILARKIIIDFKKQTNAQIVNCVVLTDGDSDQSQYVSSLHGGLYSSLRYSISNRIIVRDIQTKKEIELFAPKNRGLLDFPKTHIFVNFLRKRCNINVICYRIEKYRGKIKKTMLQYYDHDDLEVQNNYKKGSKQKYFNMKGYMDFDDYFLIFDKNNMTTEDSLMEENTFQTKGSLAKAFLKANEKRGTSRVLLSKFIERIAA